MKQGRRGRAERRTASPCCATPTATASPRRASSFLEGLNSPFGMALVGDDLYVANTDAVVRFPYKDGEHEDHRAGREGRRPARPGTSNHHWTKNLIASPDGSKLYVTVGSNSNVAENGIETEEGRAAIWEVDRKTGAPPHLRLRPAQPERPRLGAEDRRAVDGRQRARRARQRPRARLPDLGAGRRLLRLALQLLRPERRQARQAAAPRPRRQGDQARLRARLARRAAGLGLATRAAQFATAPSSASTARGTASRSPATRWSSCRSQRQAVRASRSMCSPASSSPEGRSLRAARSASRSTSAAACSSPTTSATRSGASRLASETEFSFCPISGRRDKSARALRKISVDVARRRRDIE